MKQQVLFSGLAHSDDSVDHWVLNDGDLYLWWDYEYAKGSLLIKLLPFVFYKDEWHEVTNVTFKKGFYDYKRTLDKNVPLIKELSGQFLEFEVQEPEPEPELKEKGSITYDEAITSLEQQGINNPTVPEILEKMGFTVGELVGWFDALKGYETNQIFVKGKRQTTPKYGECFMDQRFYVISSSKKRAIFTNRRVYLVDTPLYGHALYIFNDYNSALEWAENRISFKQAKDKALLRVIHSKNWKTLVEKALRGC